MSELKTSFFYRNIMLQCTGIAGAKLICHINNSRMSKYRGLSVRMIVQDKCVAIYDIPSMNGKKLDVMKDWCLLNSFPESQIQIREPKAANSENV